jgi:aminopeptidase N
MVNYCFYFLRSTAAAPYNRMTIFEPTVPMSTYLVALVIADFECINKTIAGGEKGTIDVRVCGRSNALNQLEYSLDIGVRVLQYLEKVYDIKYPLPKCGMFQIFKDK